MILKALAKADYKGLLLRSSIICFCYAGEDWCGCHPSQLKQAEEMADQLEHYKKILA